MLEKKLLMFENYLYDLFEDVKFIVNKILYFGVEIYIFDKVLCINC